ncbi:MAG TPA: hypothetical protein VFK81_05965 [Terriglobales bacterium]|nr:hypothetical protein [Terriglobales bacterium]
MPIRVLVVWEPILPTDWLPPSGMVQGRLADSRVIQFWDRGHLVAKALAGQLPSSTDGYRSRGVLWDFVALYDKQAKWNVSQPVLTGSPVVMQASALRAKLAGNPHP